MADVLQGVKNQLIPKGLKFSLPSISPLWAALIGEVILIVGIITLFLYKFFVYKIRVIEIEDRGKGYKAKILHAKEVFVNEVKKYKIWGNKDLIPTTSADFIIPLEVGFGISRDMVILHKDINGDHRPMTINESKDLDIDNQKARGWHNLKIKETLSLYKDRSEFMTKYGSVLLIAFIIFAVGIGAYLLLKK
jgi:hypothetical protein